MAERFYTARHGTPPIIVTPDAGWEQQGQAERYQMLRKFDCVNRYGPALSPTINVSSTTTQDYLALQFISDALRRQDISGTFSMAIGASESSNAVNATLACVVRLVNNDGTNPRTLLSNFNIDTEFPTTAAIRIASGLALTRTTAATGDRLVVEVGGHVAAPTAGTTFSITGHSNTQGDSALTSGSSVLDTWFEFSQNLLWPTVFPNQRYVRTFGSVLSTNMEWQ